MSGKPHQGMRIFTDGNMQHDDHDVKFSVESLFLKTEKHITD